MIHETISVIKEAIFAAIKATVPKTVTHFKFGGIFETVIHENAYANVHSFDDINPFRPLFKSFTFIKLRT